RKKFPVQAKKTHPGEAVGYFPGLKTSRYPASLGFQVSSSKGRNPPVPLREGADNLSGTGEHPLNAAAPVPKLPAPPVSERGCPEDLSGTGRQYRHLSSGSKTFGAPLAD